MKSEKPTAMRFLVGFFSIMANVVVGDVACLAAESVPFVAGYDRFFSKSNDQDTIAGQLLLTELSCTACHQADKRLAPKGGPNLQGLLSRFQPDWVRRYLNSPGDAKPGGLMPHLLHQIPDSDRAFAIEAIVAFLSSSNLAEPKIVATGANPVANEFWRKGDVARGRRLYHQVGCIACHSVDRDFQPENSKQSDLERKIESLGLDVDELEEMGLILPKPVQPVPMSSSSSKYSLRSLSMFLIDPHLVRPGGRMPSLKLQPHEAADIAAFLFQQSPEAESENRSADRSAMGAMKASEDSELVARGKKLFEQMACANCHAVPKTKPRFAKPLLELVVSETDNGCLADSQSSPRYGLSDAQKKALKSSIVNFQKLKPESIHDDLAFDLLRLNCYACHERSGRGGLGPTQERFFENVQQVDIGDEGRMPPPLDHVGRKFSKSWIQKILEGKGDVRPHFRARMPVFTENAKSLSTLFETADQLDPSQRNQQPDIVNLSKADVKAGRELLDSGCVQCHALRGESLPGAIGIDLADVATRIDPKWFHDFLLNPERLKKKTRMPSFFADGKSSSPHILEGNITLQIASIWLYLNAKDQPLPSKLEQSRSQYFELKPVDKPILIRTFMETRSGGTHAIAVGFPSQQHFAFDAKHLRLAEIWKGGFLNAQGTWFDRFAPPAIPLGTDRILFPMEPFLERYGVVSFKPIELHQKSFQGYRFDLHGIPTFRYSVGMFDFEDRIEARVGGEFVRQIFVVPNSQFAPATKPSIWLVLANDAIEVDSGGVCLTRSKLKIHASEGIEQQICKHDDDSDWMIAIPNRQEKIEVRYQW